MAEDNRSLGDESLKSCCNVCFGPSGALVVLIDIDEGRKW